MIGLNIVWDCVICNGLWFYVTGGISQRYKDHRQFPWFATCPVSVRTEFCHYICTRKCRNPCSRIQTVILVTTCPIYLQKVSRQSKIPGVINHFQLPFSHDMNFIRVTKVWLAIVNVNYVWMTSIRQCNTTPVINSFQKEFRWSP